MFELWITVCITIISLLLLSLFHTWINFTLTLYLHLFLFWWRACCITPRMAFYSQLAHVRIYYMTHYDTFISYMPVETENMWKCVVLCKAVKNVTNGNVRTDSVYSTAIGHTLTTDDRMLARLTSNCGMWIVVVSNYDNNKIQRTLTLSPDEICNREKHQIAFK